MDSDNNPKWKVHIKDTLDYYNPKIFKFIENTSNLVHNPIKATSLIDANCFEGMSNIH